MGAFESLIAMLPRHEGEWVEVHVRLVRILGK